MLLSDFVSLEPIEKGWSCDKKYKAVASDGTAYLLRITPTDKSQNRDEMFRMQQRVAAHGIPMCLPIAVGLCDEGIYTVHSWINGRDAEEVLPGLSPKEQYAYGLEAGRYLKQIHTIPASPDQPDWEIRFNRKMSRKIQMYRECPLSFDGAEKLIAYMEENRCLLVGRPQSYQHGDYHIGNMMLENGTLVIIDFDRYDFGDPWEEFNRIVWSAQAAPCFAAGTVDGYFDGKVPELFWKLLLLYIGSNTIGSVAWAVSYGEEEVRTMLAQANEVLDWYDRMDRMDRIVPSWYTQSAFSEINQ